MKPRALIIVLSFGVLMATVAMVGRQHQQVSELRSLAQELQSRTEALTNETPAAPEASQPVGPATHAGPSLELLRLRSQVGQLERRKRELAGVTEETKKLQAQLTSKATNGTGGVPLPAGYIRKSAAKFTGLGTPEDSLQSFLWAVEHRDLPTLTQCFDPESAKDIAARLEREGSTEEFWKEAGILPGLLITGREQKADGTIVLSVQIVPDDETAKTKMRFRQFNGNWRLISGF